MRKDLSTFFRFCLVGGVGFVVDGGLLTLLVNGLSFSPFYARIPSFALAVVATWILHQRITFRTAPENKLKSLASYFMSSLAGTLLNLAVYTACVMASETMHDYPVIALAFGAGAGLVFNYAVARFWLFRA